MPFGESAGDTNCSTIDMGEATVYPAGKEQEEVTVVGKSSVLTTDR
jgi:hypothetical protein